MTAGVTTRPSAGEKFGSLRALRVLDRRTTLCLCAGCQRTTVVATEALLAGVAMCPHCAPDPPEQWKEEKQTLA